jgi:hypothetical protein
VEHWQRRICGELNILCIFVGNNYLCSMKKEVGKFLLDVAKLLIGGVLLTGVMRHEKNKLWNSFISL